MGYGTTTWARTSRRVRGTAVAGALLALGATGLAAGALAPTAGAADAGAVRTVQVTPGDLQGWTGFARDSGSWALEQGPSTPPLGGGSLRLRTPAGNDKAALTNAGVAGTPLSALTRMDYSTFREEASTATPLQTSSLQMSADVNGSAAGGVTTLVYEPYYSVGAGGIVEGVWQDWDAYDGGAATWWSTAAIPGACSFTCYVPWSDIVAANPDAVMRTVVVNQGGGNPGLLAAADAVTVATAAGGTTWDFELVADGDGDGVADGADNCPAASNPDQVDADGDGAGAACDTPEVPTSTEQCKRDGWRAFDGTSTFRNQGECVSSVASRR